MNNHKKAQKKNECFWSLPVVAVSGFFQPGGMAWDASGAVARFGHESNHTRFSGVGPWYKSVPYCEQTIRKTVKICQCLQVKICKFYQETNTFMIKSLGVHKCWDKQICSSQYSAKPFTLSPRPGLSGRTSQLGIEAHPKFSKVYPPWWSCLKNGILG